MTHLKLMGVCDRCVEQNRSLFDTFEPESLSSLEGSCELCGPPVIVLNVFKVPFDTVCLPAPGGRRCLSHHMLPLYPDGLCEHGRESEASYTR